MNTLPFPDLSLPLFVYHASSLVLMDVSDVNLFTPHRYIIISIYRRGKLRHEKVRHTVLAEGLGSGARWYGSRTHAPNSADLQQASCFQGACIWGLDARRPASKDTGPSSSISAAALSGCLFRDL